MKTLKLIRSNYLIIALSILAATALTSCHIDADNDIGPRGPQGEPGVSDVNIIQYEITPDKWIGNVNGYKTVIYLDELNEYVYQNGAVLVYRLNEDDPDKFANMLPYTYLYNSSSEYMDFSAYIGHLDITLRWTDNGVNSTLAPATNYIFKIVLIKGMNISALKEKVNVSSLDNVTQYFTLK